MDRVEKTEELAQLERELGTRLYAAASVRDKLKFLSLEFIAEGNQYVVANVGHSLELIDTDGIESVLENREQCDRLRDRILSRLSQIRGHTKGGVSATAVDDTLFSELGQCSAAGIETPMRAGSRSPSIFAVPLGDEDTELRSAAVEPLSEKNLRGQDGHDFTGKRTGFAVKAKSKWQTPFSHTTGSYLRTPVSVLGAGQMVTTLREQLAQSQSMNADLLRMMAELRTEVCALKNERSEKAAARGGQTESLRDGGENQA